MKLQLKNEITSIELVDEINKFRKEEGTKTELRHKDLLNIIRDEFSEEITERKISPSEYKDKTGRKLPMFNLTLSQAKQVLVRESKFVRRAIIQYIEKLENHLMEATEITMTVPIKVPDNILLELDDIIVEEVKGFENKKGKRYEIGILAVSGRQLWSKLEVKTYFTDWIKRRIDKYGFQENIDYIWYGDDYALTIDMAGELALIENTQIGRDIRKYLVEYERNNKSDKYKEQQQIVERLQKLEESFFKPSKINKNIDSIQGNFFTINHITELIQDDLRELQRLFQKISHKEAERKLYIDQLKRVINL